MNEFSLIYRYYDTLNHSLLAFLTFHFTDKTLLRLKPTWVKARDYDLLVNANEQGTQIVPLSHLYFVVLFFFFPFFKHFLNFKKESTVKKRIILKAK